MFNALRSELPLKRYSYRKKNYTISQLNKYRKRTNTSTGPNSVLLGLSGESAKHYQTLMGAKQQKTELGQAHLPHQEKKRNRGSPSGPWPKLVGWARFSSAALRARGSCEPRFAGG